jgi:hypothetical protein
VPPSIQAIPSEQASAPPGPAGELGPKGEMPLPAAQAWGSIETVRLPISVGGDRHLVLESAATSDGRYVICADQPNAVDAAVPAYEEPSYISLYEVSTARLTRMARLVTLRSQVLSASSDGEWVVWTEAGDQPNFFDWRLRAYDIRTGDVREIAKATVHDGEPVSGPLSFVTVSHGLAVWGQTVGQGAGPGQMQNAVVRQADLATGKITTLATSAGMPALSWPWLAYGVSEGDRGFMQVTDLETGFARRLDITPPQFALDGASAAYNDSASLSMLLMDDLGQSTPAVEIARGVTSADHIEWPTLNERIVGWALNGHSDVYDRAKRRLVTVPILYGWSSVVVSGPLMMWEETDPATSKDRAWPDWIVVVNTNALPILP